MIEIRLVRYQWAWSGWIPDYASARSGTIAPNQTYGPGQSPGSELDRKPEYTGQLHVYHLITGLKQGQESAKEQLLIFGSRLVL